MRNIKKKEYSLVKLRSLNDLNSELSKLIRQNSDIIIEVNSERLLEIVDRDPNSRFSFTIEEVTQGKDNSIGYTCEIAPTSSGNVSRSVFELTPTGVVKFFKDWLEILRRYNEISLNPDEIFEREYENEFTEMFEIVDEDAEIKPFDYERQLFIYNYLQEIIDTLESKNEPKLQEVIAEAKSLQENLQNETKKTTVRKLSKILGKVRKAGIKFLSELYDVGKKEILKKIFNGALNEVGNLIDNIPN